MDKFLIRGGAPLAGEVQTSGAKNSALPVLAASLLSSEPVTLRRIPQVRDIGTMQKLLRYNGATVDVDDSGTVRVHAATIANPEAPYEIVKTMRASSLVLGPLVARTGRARVSMPGGCAIGARPINLHVNALESLGARIHQEHGYVEARADNGLKGGKIKFDRITVTGTEDLLMAAVLAEGETVIDNAAREPEVVDVANLLTQMGAKIEGAGTSTITVQGVSSLKGADHTIIPDRIEAGTFLIAGAITGGDVRINGCNPEHLMATIDLMRQAGSLIETGEDWMHVRKNGQLRSVDMTTVEYPGFATDLQAQFLALMTQAEGISLIEETIFENRFMHVPELGRMGAKIRIEGRRAIVAGASKLSGAPVTCSDLRASASLILAALVAEGESLVDRVYHVDRGYENLEQKLAGLGASITRVA
ncbi:UDP-N-acetylglucosamine 1-carboxyvinyltransferase [Bryobacterales bacterium F-183]|nr:UDP-N-acetylglucosamine 1-carboxyvinyltransferase [Bryobacterales bacterium F-183]